MTLRDSSHARQDWPRVWEQDVAPQFEEAQDGPLLVCLLQLLERARQMASCSKHGRATCPVVPVESGVQGNRLVPAETDQQLLDQQPVVDDDQARGGGHPELLISQIWIVDGRDPVLIAIPEHATEFGAGHCYSPWYD